MLSFPVAKWQKLNPTLSRSKKIAQFNACASLIVPRLYLADYRTASDGDELRRLGITHIVSVIDFTPVFPDCIDKDNILHIPVADKSEVRILPFLPQTTQFIRDALEQDVANRVLVHCVQGISRSATVVCAYLMATKNMLAPKSILYVQERRTIVCPNLGFRLQLEEYEAELIKGGSMSRGGAGSWRSLSSSISSLVLRTGRKD
ncbi:Protein-tyrosine phosphatase-like protein [Pleurotus pulmonarius]